VESLRTLVRASPAYDPEASVGQIAGPAQGGRTPFAAASLERDRPPAGNAGNGARITGNAAPSPDGLVLARYRLIERLGSGGFGVVWRAHDELLHREVAVKRIPLGLDGDSERASREALASARLAHPAIVALYEACAVGEAFYLISELVHGETLAKLIALGGLADEQVLEIGVALADALSHAHSRGVIHRDVKPQNVLVPHRPQDPRGAAKLTDFGGARLAGEDVLTRTGDVLGTLAYMAPEQSEGREVGEAADLYALSLVLHESLSGVNPVRGSTPADTARRIGRTHAPLEDRRGDLPRALARALDRGMAPSPADRGTLEELRSALKEGSGKGSPRPRRGRRSERLPPQKTQQELGDRVLARPAVPEWQAAPPRRGMPPRRAAPAAQALSAAPTLPAPTLPAPEVLARRHSTPAWMPPHEQDATGARSRRGMDPALPRAIWLGCALAVIIWQAWIGHPGVALLAFAAVVPLVAFRRRVSAGWLVCALAPLLGLAGLANAYPAIAGQATRWRARAGLGALGYWWLILAEPLLARRLWLGHPPGTPARAVWEGSLPSAAVHVVGPMLSLGVLLGAALWAAAAVVLPWIVRGRRALQDVAGAVIWSAAIVLLEPTLDGGLATHPGPRGALVGALLGGALAVAARALRGPV
jgi:eukaryotic-like serine/threonine-protein kinase